MGQEKFPSPEAIGRDYDVQDIDVQRTQELFEQIEESIVSRKAVALIGDPVERTMLMEVLPEFLNSEGKTGRMRSHVEQVYAFKRAAGKFFPPGYDLRMLELAIDNQMKLLFPDVYPQYFPTPAYWRKNDVFGQLDYDKLTYDMAYRNQAYNYPRAYGFFHWQTQCLYPRWGGRPPIVVDIGDGEGNGLRQWALQDEFPFIPMKMYKMPVSGPIGPNLEPDYEAQEAVNDLTRREPIIGGALGIDVLPINHRDRAGKDWSFSTTFPMSEELRNPEAVDEFKKLQWVDPEKLRRERNVHIYEYSVDATSSSDMEQLGQLLPGGKADFYIISGARMQMSDQQFYRLIQNLKKYSNPGALLSMSEWAVPDRREPLGVRIIRKNWWHRRGAYANFLYELDENDPVPISFGRFLTRKCEEMVLTKQGRKLLLSQ